MLNLCVIIVISIYRVKASYGDHFYVITLYFLPKCVFELKSCQHYKKNSQCFANYGRR